MGKCVLESFARRAEDIENLLALLSHLHSISRHLGSVLEECTLLRAPEHVQGAICGQQLRRGNMQERKRANLYEACSISQLLALSSMLRASTGRSLVRIISRVNRKLFQTRIFMCVARHDRIQNLRHQPTYYHSSGLGVAITTVRGLPHSRIHNMRVNASRQCNTHACHRQPHCLKGRGRPVRVGVPRDQSGIIVNIDYTESLHVHARQSRHCTTRVSGMLSLISCLDYKKQRITTS